MEFLSAFLPIILYILLAILLVILIILGLKMINIINRCEIIADDVERKIHSLDRLFNVIDNMSDKLSSVSDRMIMFVSNIISNLFKRKKRKEENIDEK